MAAVLLAASCGTAASIGSEDVYLSQDAFLSLAFNGTPPQPQLLWLTGELRERVSDVLGHPPGVVRLRYWQSDARSAWILEEIGKERPITVGIVVEAQKIRDLEVLIYRESRGWEVRNDFFTRRFSGATLGADDHLDRRIDNIAGATLSVNAVRKLAHVALMLDQHLRAE
ncbi:MAG: FMN-binding protein [Nevskiales bacterium]|nr:FMN-binding protein [Nevskiales bacterium]